MEGKVVRITVHQTGPSLRKREREWWGGGGWGVGGGEREVEAKT